MKRGERERGSDRREKGERERRERGREREEEEKAQNTHEKFETNFTTKRRCNVLCKIVIIFFHNTQQFFADRL
jgi:hypothetical protein